MCHPTSQRWVLLAATLLLGPIWNGAWAQAIQPNGTPAERLHAALYPSGVAGQAPVELPPVATIPMQALPETRVSYTQATNMPVVPPAETAAASPSDNWPLAPRAAALIPTLASSSNSSRRTREGGGLFQWPEGMRGKREEIEEPFDYVQPAPDLRTKALFSNTPPARTATAPAPTSPPAQPSASAATNPFGRLFPQRALFRQREVQPAAAPAPTPVVDSGLIVQPPRPPAPPVVRSTPMQAAPMSRVATSGGQASQFNAQANAAIQPQPGTASRAMFPPSGPTEEPLVIEKILAPSAPHALFSRGSAPSAPATESNLNAASAPSAGRSSRALVPRSWWVRGGTDTREVDEPDEWEKFMPKNYPPGVRSLYSRQPAQAGGSPVAQGAPANATSMSTGAGAASRPRALFSHGFFAFETPVEERARAAQTGAPSLPMPSSVQLSRDTNHTPALAGANPAEAASNSADSKPATLAEDEDAQAQGTIRARPPAVEVIAENTHERGAQQVATATAEPTTWKPSRRRQKAQKTAPERESVVNAQGADESKQTREAPESGKETAHVDLESRDEQSGLEAGEPVQPATKSTSVADGPAGKDEGDSDRARPQAAEAETLGQKPIIVTDRPQKRRPVIIHVNRQGDAASEPANRAGSNTQRQDGRAVQTNALAPAESQGSQDNAAEPKTVNPLRASARRGGAPFSAADRKNPFR